MATWLALGRGAAARHALAAGALVGTGAALPLLVMLGLLMVQGTIRSYVFWTVQYALAYTGDVSWRGGQALLSYTMNEITRANAWLWLAALAGGLLTWVSRWPLETRVLLTGLLVASCVAVAPGLYFRQHYFIVLLPAAALFAGLAVATLARARGTATGAAQPDEVVAGDCAIRQGRSLPRQGLAAVVLPFASDGNRRDEIRRIAASRKTASVARHPQP